MSKAFSNAFILTHIALNALVPVFRLKSSENKEEEEKKKKEKKEK